VNDNMIVAATGGWQRTSMSFGGRTSSHCPRGARWWRIIEGELLLVMGDNITTDHIMPSRRQILPVALERACAERVC
jgi:aconitase A